MGLQTTSRAASRPVLFVAREPDETLRTFLPVIDCLQQGRQQRLQRACAVLFHHAPGPWARSELAARGIVPDEVVLAKHVLPARLAALKGGGTADEIGRLWQARQRARAALKRHRPSAVVVIQDTILLERFLVREANALGIPTLVVQWAFSYAQAMYDRIRTFQYGPSSRTGRAGGHGRGVPAAPARRLLAPLTGAAYRSTLKALGLHFDLVNSYGGGEARLFAVMGEAFREQFLAQGVRGKRIVPTGHPTHDAVFRRAQAIDDAERLAIRARYDLPPDRTIALYATQPVLWRKVMTREALEANVRAMAAAVQAHAQTQVQASPGCELVLKLHPREDPADYTFCASIEAPVRVITQAEMPDLIAASDLFISSSSSTVLLAMLLDRPIVTVNFDNVPHFDQFEEIGGTLHVRTHADFAAAVARLLGDAEAAEQQRQARADVIARYTRFDGRAAERIADLLEEAIAGQQPTSDANAPARSSRAAPTVEAVR